MGETDLVVDLPVPLKVCGVLVQFLTILAAHAVDYQMVVQMPGINMSGNDHLEVREQLLSQLHTDGVDLLRSQSVPRGEGLNEMIKLSAAPFLESPLGHHHFQIG